MPVAVSYPGIYIEELPSNTHPITAAPTSITVFVGYTHPFKTREFRAAVRVFDYSDYEREFGGMYVSGVVDSSVAYALNQFFLNGGADAYVVGLQPQYLDNATPPTGHVIDPPTATIGSGATGIVFTGREPTDVVEMTVAIDNLKSTRTPDDTADITVTYGTRTEIFRGVTLSTLPQDTSQFIEARLGTVAQPVSSLLTVSPPVGGYPATFTKTAATALVSTPPANFATTFNSNDFTGVFQADAPLDKVDIFNLLTIPGVSDNAIWSAAVAFCERKQAFAIIDPPAQAAGDSITAALPGGATLPVVQDLFALVPRSANAAFYFPYLRAQDPLLGKIVEFPPSGYVAGIFARTDVNRGVWKAPAGLETTMRDTVGVVPRGRLTDTRHGVLNLAGINCLRTFESGTVVFGARTVVSDNTAFAQWKYVPVRRMALFLEQTLYRSLGWVVFEPNDEPLWVAIRTNIENFMLGLFRQGAFQGTKPNDAFQVKCDASTTTQQDIDNGTVNIIVAFAPLKPAEFVVIKIAQLAGQVQS